MSTIDDARVFLVLMAARLVGDYVYAWGGDAPEEGGFDCSGFVCRALTQTARAWPELYDGERRTAAGLYGWYDEQGCPDFEDAGALRPGCLLFYRRPGRRIHHVALHAVTVPPVLLGERARPAGPIAFEAGGAGSGAVTPRAALERAAGIRLRASDHHPGAEWVAKDPFRLLCPQ
jgi:hypothetical protein